MKIKKYYYKYVKYTCITVVLGFIVYAISKYFPSSNYIAWIIKAILLGCLSLITIIIFTHKDTEYLALKDSIKGVLSKIKNKFGGKVNEKNS